jgi:hypothetical protein
VDKGIGRTLREARSRRKVELAEVEAQTKIRARFLRAIENEEWDALPGDAYARSFIRTYASFLGLDGDRLAEEHRRNVGAPPERPMPRGPAPRRPRRREAGSGPRIPTAVWTALVVAALVAVLLIVGLSGGGGGGTSGGHARHAGQRHQGAGPSGRAKLSSKRGVAVLLVASAEVWVCLLNGKGNPLVDGQVLAAGEEAGPFRSGSFTVGFGNGEVSMTVNGREASIPATSSPIGYSIGRDGSLTELSEGRRPTCT